jgi:hypothetical protein
MRSLLRFKHQCNAVGLEQELFIAVDKTTFRFESEAPYFLKKTDQPKLGHVPAGWMIKTGRLAADRLWSGWLRAMNAAGPAGTTVQILLDRVTPKRYLIIL